MESDCLPNDNQHLQRARSGDHFSVQEGSAGTARTSTFAFDGYGRLATSHAPIQPTNSVTSYSYNPDDTIATTTDARKALATFTYNKRHQTTQVSYSAPSGITSAPTANFTYDATGNRTTMTDGLGSVSYQYDPLSRMTSESRVFSSLGSTPYTLTYAYNLAGQLTSITDPWNAQVGYTRDIIGRLTAVTGSGYPNIPQAGYASQLQYRAWGALKSMTYGNGVPISLSYNNRLQVSHYTLTSTGTNIPSPSMDINYSYSADGRLKLSTDNRDATLDRAYKFDQVGRLVEAFTASEARSWVQTGNIGTTEDGPYRQSYTLDTWDNMGTKWGRSFTGTHRRTQTVIRYYNALTGRVNGWGYDNAGNNTSGDYVMNSYDAAGRFRESVGSDTVLGRFEYDGDGVKTKSLTETAYVFLLRSSVLGEKLAEIQTSDGTRWNGFVFADGELIATQSMGLIDWQHRDPSQRSTRTTDANQEGVGHDELDPNGVKVDVPGGNHYNGGSGGGHMLGSGGIAARVASLMDIKTCDFYGMAVPCSMKDSFQEHISSLDKGGQDHWNGKTTAQDYLVITLGDMERIPGAIDFNHKRKKKKTITLPIGPPRTISISDLGRDKKEFGHVQKSRTDLPDYARSVYQGALGEKLTDCINSVFANMITDKKGRTAKGSDLLEYQQIGNAPYVDETQSSSDLDGYGGSKPLDWTLGPNGTVRIAGDITDRSGVHEGKTYTIGAFELQQRTYVHELGNNLSRRISQHSSANTFGDPNGITGLLGSPSDYDTGAALERCVFGNVAP